MGSLENGWHGVRRHIIEMAELIEKHGSDCVWVTPPDVLLRRPATQDAFASMYEEALAGRCAVFNSRPLHRPYMDYRRLMTETGLARSQTDGLHYRFFGKSGRAARSRWAQEIVQFIRDRIQWQASQIPED
jgi:hypothetical protein